MKALVFHALLAALLIVSAQAQAQPAAVVEGVQMPAWVERDGQRTPIQPGMVLQPGDVIHTGPGSRLMVRMSEKSLVKLGENGRLRFTEISTSKEIFKAVMGVLEGAFRFTTDLAVKNRRREVSITVANVTAGIRGTDLWGRSRADTEIEAGRGAGARQPVARQVRSHRAAGRRLSRQGRDRLRAEQKRQLRVRSPMTARARKPSAARLEKRCRDSTCRRQRFPRN